MDDLISVYANPSTRRGPYKKYTPEERARIGQYAVKYGITEAPYWKNSACNMNVTRAFVHMYKHACCIYLYMHISCNMWKIGTLFGHVSYIKHYFNMHQTRTYTVLLHACDTNGTCM